MNESLQEPKFLPLFATLQRGSGTGPGDVPFIGQGFPPEQLEIVHQHWLSFPAPPAAAHTALSILYVAMTLASLTGNALVIYVFTTSKVLRTASNLFVVNLAFCDFMMMAKAPIFIFNSIMKGPACGANGCALFAFVGSLSGIGSGATNACIAYDRHSTITRPLDGRISKGKAILLILLVWCYVLPWSLLPLLGIWGKYIPEGYQTSCTFDYLTRTPDNQLFVGSIFFCSYCIPLFFMIYFYSGIVRQVVLHEKALKEQAKKMNVESLRANQNNSGQSAEIRIARAAITICFLFLCSWTPYGVMSLIGAFGDASMITPGVSMIPAVTCKLVSCIDPWVYAISHPKYRIELQKKLPWLQIREPDDTASTATTTTTSPTTGEQAT